MTVRPWVAALPALAVALLFLPPGGALSSASTHVSATNALAHQPAMATPRAAVAPLVAAAPSASAHPSAGAFNPNCYPVDTGVCVSIMNPGETNIVPLGANRSASVMPDCSFSMPLVVKSHIPLNASGGSSPRFGPHSPIALNVTGTLWNGDPYYSKFDGSIWHANTNIWWTLIGNGPQNDKTYPWWYMVNLSATGASNNPNFFPGEQVTWWIYLVYSLPNSFYQPHEGPHLTYTCAGAWPYSPYPGSPHYGGPASISLDTSITLNPRIPNWNDSVFVTINTTQADVEPYNATIGAATLDLVEVAHGTVIANISWSFNVTVDSGFGNTTTTSRIPPQYAQIEGATISYRLWVSDTSKVGDWLVSPWTNYTVNGNGSFATGSFTSDLTLVTDPTSVLFDNFGEANLTPGEPLHLQVLSRNPTDAILAVEVEYTVAYPLLHETIPEVLSLNRFSSIDFRGDIPALPLDTIVNFTLLAWDFTDAVEIANPYSYTVQTQEEYAPLTSSLAFFWVFVYDNGTRNWVEGAEVQILGPNDVLNSVGHTTLGVAYANQSGKPYLPLLVQNNATYNVTVTDNRFVPGGGNAGPYGAISVSVKATNPMSARQPLASTPQYVVLQEGDQILFYLNATAPPAPAAPPVATGSPLENLGVAAVLGLLAASLVSIPLLIWWRQIKARRTAEEKRVTL